MLVSFFKLPILMFRFSVKVSKLLFLCMCRQSISLCRLFVCVLELPFVNPISYFNLNLLKDSGRKGSGPIGLILPPSLASLSAVSFC